MPDPLHDYLVSVYGRLVDLHYERALVARVVVCPLCGFSAARAGFGLHASECQFDGSRIERYGCPDCDLVFGPLKMLDLTPAQLAAEYRMLYSYYREADSTVSEIRAFQACRPRKGGVYLNWGCGAWSATIEQLRSEGWDVWGYEPIVPSESPFVVNSRAELSARFAGIFSNNVIEHLQDPAGELRAMSEHLAPGGALAHASPCYELRYENTRFHLFFYLGRSVEMLAERAGLGVGSRERDGEYMHVVFTPAVTE